MSRILIVAPSWVGDMVVAQSLVAVLKQREPGATVDLLAPPWSAPLGIRMPGVDTTIAIDTAHGRFDLFKRIGFGRKLRGEGYDRAIVLPSSWKSAVAPYFAGIPQRAGYVGEMRYGLLTDARPLDKKKLVRTVERFIALGLERDAALPEIPSPMLTRDPATGRKVAAKLGLKADGKLIALCPGAEYGPSKQWPAAHFAALADILARQGYRSWILGSGKDAAVADEIVALTAVRNKQAAPVNLAGKTSLGEAIDLMAVTAGVATNDSGLMHIAAAIDRPIVALYGSTNPVMTPPLGRRVVILERTLPCRPCFQRTCPLGHLDCLNLIPAAEVAERVLDQVEPVA